MSRASLESRATLDELLGIDDDIFMLCQFLDLFEEIAKDTDEAHARFVSSRSEKDLCFYKYVLLDRNNLLDEIRGMLEVEESRGRVCLVETIRQSTEEDPARFRVHINGSLKVWLKSSLSKLSRRGMILAERARQKNACAAELIRERCRSAIDRSLAWLALDGLVEISASLAIEALHSIRPVPPPRVVAGTDGAALFVIRC